jgi:hypothetical protein
MSKKELYMNQEQVMVEPPSVTSFLTRVTNVFSSPTELYGEVASVPPQTSSWLLPYLASLLLAVVFTFSLYNNAALRQQIYDMQLQGMQQSVDQGKMTQEQFDRMKDGMESSGPGMFMLIGGGGAVLAITLYFFGITLLLWLVAKFGLKFAGAYGKMLEVYGLASVIGFFGAIVTLLMMNFFNTMHATPSGSLLVMNSYDKSNFVHNLLASINIFTIWQAAVIGIGIAKVSNKSSGTGMGIVFGLWLVWVIVSSALGWVR